MVFIWTFKEIWKISLFLNFFWCFLHFLQKFLWILNSICITPLILILIFKPFRFISILFFFFCTVLFDLIFILVTLCATLYNWTLLVLIAHLQTFRRRIRSLMLINNFCICQCWIPFILFGRLYSIFYFLRWLLNKCTFFFWSYYRCSSCYELRAWCFFILF